MDFYKDFIYSADNLKNILNIDIRIKQKNQDLKLILRQSGRKYQTKTRLLFNYVVKKRRD